MTDARKDHFLKEWEKIGGKFADNYRTLAAGVTLTEDHAAMGMRNMANWWATEVVPDVHRQAGVDGDPEFDALALATLQRAFDDRLAMTSAAGGSA